MHPAASLVVEHALKNLHLVAPIVFVLLATAANIWAPVHHSLLITTVSWAVIWLGTVFKAGLWSGGSRSRKTTSWLAGGFLALSQLCERAACDKLGIWAAKGLLPAVVVLLSEREFLSKHIGLPSYTSVRDDSSGDGTTSSEKSTAHPKSFRLLAFIAVSATAALAVRYTISSTWALALSSVIFTATGLVLFEGALKDSKNNGDGNRGFMSANGTFSRRSSLEGAHKDRHLASLRDVAAVMVVLCGAATYLTEPAINPGAISWQPAYSRWGANWQAFHYHRTIQQCLLMMFVNIVINVSMFILLLQQSSVTVSVLMLSSCIAARLSFGASFIGVWFTVIYGLAASSFIFNSSPSSDGTIRTPLRLKRIMFGVTAMSICFLFMRYASDPRHHPTHSTTPDANSFDALTPERPFAPVTIDLGKGHPALQLIKSAEKDFQDLLDRQSKSLEAAVLEYRRRHGVHPPPHFDKWYEFATRNGVQLIDEFDMINDMLLPYWGMKPSTIRLRVKNALGFQKNALVGMMVRNGDVVKVEGGPEWQQQATAGMMKDFVQYLPDMDLAFNIHDEPRVVVPNDALSGLVALARDKGIPAAVTTQSPRNSFSSRPSDVSDGKRFEEVKTSRFNEFAHQQTWTHARLSCPNDSPARDYEDQGADNLTSYATAPLNYIYNHTAFSDICRSPSLAYTFGFFERPNAFNVIHELTPIFSQSKVSSFNDLLYPSPWYWFEKVRYDESKDRVWKNKTNSFYWRGSSTGGFSRNGGWRRQHRQHVVRRLSALDKAEVLVNSGNDNSPAYEVQDVNRKDWQPLIDVKFSHIGQCDDGDCDAQKEFFEVVDKVDREDAWQYKHLLDMDGNAFSGRFYAFLRSKSLTYKMALFREWHQEWLKPWVHYIPLTLIGDEHLDLVRFFGGADQQKDGPKEGSNGNGNSIGEQKAKEIAERSTEWANKVLRNVDFEVWFFRLLLEYGRIIDDNRDSIGYAGP
ncbi:hypothetical protein BDV96DRAFT_625460 [Lophiotrema nucula]|uniref:Glycosyl transferase CAP10 domain-containing protein n=1 Tax=Lophiotrema nucula TaxID=690887 RepID=A0A6A5YMP4_9PLEO|nr:hypothetical protein BDV96DRAFT_625460 [Lophiotrema nucula]